MNHHTPCDNLYYIVSTNILGISAFYHDSAACLLRDGEVIAAAQEERFTRRKHDPEFPQNAIRFCLKAGGIQPGDLDYVAFYDKPFIKFERLLKTYLTYAPFGIRSFLLAMPLWLKRKLWIKALIEDELKGFNGKMLFPEHHESHAASAFYPSPFDQAAFITLDGVGEWTTTSYGQGKGNQIQIMAEIKFPHSLGLLYSAFTYFTGFRVNSGEYKLMGLAPYGEPRYVDLIKSELIDVREDGSFKLNLKYFNYMTGLTMTNSRFAKLFGGPPRKPESEMTQREMDMARSVQAVTEEIMLKIARHLHRLTGQKNLCLAGGVALNCVGNGLILREGPFEKIWIQPAAGDAGGALGAAFQVWHRHLGKERHSDEVHDKQRASLLGPEYSVAEIEKFLKDNNIPHNKLDLKEVAGTVAGLIADQNVVGWFQGRMEFGPRALGARSILGDARSPRMQSILNLKIKSRESFRPFAPTVLCEEVSNYFEMDRPSPYMLLTAPVKNERRREMTGEQRRLFGMEKLKVARSEIPAITHVDYSARLQTVSHDENPLYHEMIKAFQELTGCPVIINTSFNVRGEPIVCSPDDAYRCFMRTQMDYLIMGPYLLDKKHQPEWHEKIDWKKVFPPD